jgi:acetamidase/formamidase
LEPILTIDHGDTVVYRTLDADWNLAPHAFPGSRTRQFAPRMSGLDDGHALCGPIAIRGAEPSMVLEVRIEDVVPGDWGWNGAGARESVLHRGLGMTETRWTPLLWSLDRTEMTGRNQFGNTVALHPFMGVMGMPPDLEGTHSTAPPRTSGGNIDCKELVAGTSLYLPIPVTGGLFSVGDGHAAQGDGELSGTAIECPMDRVQLTFRLHEDMPLHTPTAETETAWITFGFHEDLDEAMVPAVEAMLDRIRREFDLSKAEALALGSVVVDVRVTQVVNGVLGVHAILEKCAVR